MTLVIDFQALRDAWALKAPPLSRDTMVSKLQYDAALNPHGDSYKPERRGETEITSDEAYKFADEVLYRQYGPTYTDWLRTQGYEERSHYRGYALKGPFARGVRSPGPDPHLSDN